MRRLYRWVGFVPRVTVALKEEACLLLVRDKNVHTRLKVHVLELGMYGVVYKLQEACNVALAQVREAAEAAAEDVQGVP